MAWMPVKAYTHLTRITCMFMAGIAIFFLPAIIKAQCPLQTPGAFTTSSPAVCQGQFNVAYTVPSVASATNYTWSYSGTGALITNNANSANISFSTTATSGTLSVTAYNIACGTSSASNIAITVNALPVITTKVTNTTVLPNGTTNFTTSATGVGLSYGWSYDPGGGYIGLPNPGIYSGATTNTLTLTNVPASYDGYRYTCLVSNACGTATTTQNATLYVNTATTLISSPQDVTICAGTNTSFTVAALGLGPLTYQWQHAGIGGIFVDLANNPPYSGVNTPTLTVTSAPNGGSAILQCKITQAGVNLVNSSPAVLTVISIPAQPGAFTIGPSTVCPNQSNVIYTVPNDPVAQSYQWSYSGTGVTLTQVGNNVMLNFSSTATNGTLSVTATNSCGTSPARTIAITVNTLPAQPGAFTLGQSNVCQGNNNLIYTVPNDPTVTYNWSYSGTGATITNNGNSASVNYSFTATSGNMSVTATNGCGVSAARVLPVTMGLLPTAPGAFTAGPNSNVCQGLSSVVYTIPNDPTVTYSWSYSGTGVTIVGTTNSVLLNFSNTATGGQLIVTALKTCGAAARVLQISITNLPSFTTQPSNAVINSGANTSFSVAATGPPVTPSGLTYQWQVNTGSGFTNLSNSGVYSGVTTSTLSLTAVPASMDSYQYQCVASGYCGPVNSNTATLTVNSISITSSPSDKTVCVASNTSFTVAATSTGAAVTYQWQVNSGSGFANVSNTGVYSGATTATLTITGVTANMTGYIYKCILSQSPNNTATSGSATLTVDNPSAAFTVNANAECFKNNSFNFTSTSVPVSGTFSYSWNFGDGSSIVTSSHVIRSYAAAGIFKAVLTVTSSLGCVDSSFQNITVNYMPVVNFSLPSICLPNGSGQFNDASTIGDNTQNLFSYLWNFGDPANGTPSTIKNPTHKYSATGPYTVKLQITSSNGCIDSLSQQLTTIFPQPKAAFSFTPATLCLGQLVQFTDQSNGMGSAVKTWAWDLANGDVSALQNPTKAFVDSGIFNISLHVVSANNCPSDTVTQLLTVYPYPVLIMGPGLVVKIGTTIPVVPQYYYGNNLQFSWTPSTYLDNTTVVNPNATPTNNITYQLTITGTGGCAVSDTISVTILADPIVPNAFSPNGDGINDTWKIQYLSFYPTAVVQIFSRAGQPVFSSVGYSKEWDGTYNGKPLPIGTYYYVIDMKNGKQPLSGSITIIR